MLSGGRAQLGLGAAWYRREHEGLGVRFPPVSERFERLEEALQICMQMWSDDDGPFVGRHYQLAETICEPRPISQPRPPVMIGGSGERKTLRLVARYADACNLFAADPAAVAHKLDVLRRHCDNEQRDYDTIRKTILAMGDPFADTDAFVDQIRVYAELGIDTVIFMPSGDPVAYTKRLGTDIAGRLGALRRLTPARRQQVTDGTASCRGRTHCSSEASSDGVTRSLPGRSTTRSPRPRSSR